MDPRNRVLDEGQDWMISFAEVGDAAFCQISLDAYYYYDLQSVFRWHLSSREFCHVGLSYNTYWLTTVTATLNTDFIILSLSTN